ncbi:hypothetical protein QR98_0104050 [Sarcoptes scabiei]|uniref:Uncharacterized protein n=1 Tax=Sarcoptes scabiei TaxID=52283 RepID=A0A132ALU7_SARSC|nr:hypothetical protein QR98_0104050 [Sarcoptes scabiei]
MKMGKISRRKRKNENEEIFFFYFFFFPNLWIIIIIIIIIVFDIERHRTYRHHDQHRSLNDRMIEVDCGSKEERRKKKSLRNYSVRWEAIPILGLKHLG